MIPFEHTLDIRERMRVLQRGTRVRIDWMTPRSSIEGVVEKNNGTCVGLRVGTRKSRYYVCPTGTDMYLTILERPKDR